MKLAVTKTPHTSESDAQNLKQSMLKYMQLMIDCANDETKKKALFDNPHTYLNDPSGVAMNIPENVDVRLVTDKAWPTVYIKKTENGAEKIAVIEGNHALEVMEDQDTSDPHVKWLTPEEVKPEVREALKHSSEVVELPFLDMDKMVKTEVNYADNKIECLGSS